MGAHRRPTPINPEQRRLIVTESAPPLSKSALDSAWQGLIRRAMSEGSSTGRAASRFTA